VLENDYENIDDSLNLSLSNRTLFIFEINWLFLKKNYFLPNGGGFFYIYEKGDNKMEKLNRSVAKKMDMDSQEFKENDFWIIDGTPQYLWDEFWNLMQFTTDLNKNALDIFKPLNRNVSRKFYAEY